MIVKDYALRLRRSMGHGCDLSVTFDAGQIQHVTPMMADEGFGQIGHAALAQSVA